MGRPKKNEKLAIIVKDNSIDSERLTSVKLPKIDIFRLDKRFIDKASRIVNNYHDAYKIIMVCFESISELLDRLDGTVQPPLNDWQKYEMFPLSLNLISDIRGLYSLFKEEMNSSQTREIERFFKVTASSMSRENYSKYKAKRDAYFEGIRYAECLEKLRVLDVIICRYNEVLKCEEIQHDSVNIISVIRAIRMHILREKKKIIKSSHNTKECKEFIKLLESNGDKPIMWMNSLTTGITRSFSKSSVVKITTPFTFTTTSTGMDISYPMMEEFTNDDSRDIFEPLYVNPERDINTFNSRIQKIMAGRKDLVVSEIKETKALVGSSNTDAYIFDSEVIDAEIVE